MFFMSFSFGCGAMPLLPVRGMKTSLVPSFVLREDQAAPILGNQDKPSILISVARERQWNIPGLATGWLPIGKVGKPKSQQGGGFRPGGKASGCPPVLPDVISGGGRRA